MNLLLGL